MADAKLPPKLLRRSTRMIITAALPWGAVVADVVDYYFLPTLWALLVGVVSAWAFMLAFARALDGFVKAVRLSDESERVAIDVTTNPFIEQLRERAKKQ